MKFAYKSLVVTAALVAVSGAANAAVDTLVVGGSVTDSGWTLDQLQGSGTLQFSSTLLAAFNLTAAKLASISPAVVSYTTSTNSKGVVNYTSASAAAPVSTLTGSFDGTTFNVMSVGTGGGAAITTVQNSAVNAGGGFLNITNLSVDITSKIVYADISGGNGVGNLSHYALWSFDPVVTHSALSGISGPTTFTVPNPAAQTTFVADNTISGLFSTTATIDMMALALNLNTTGKNGLIAVNNYTTNPAGFGSVVSHITSVATPVAAAVPEPGTYALMGLGLAGISLATRRRAA
jgi:hypothetical protein